MKDMQEYVGKEIMGFEFRDTPYVDYSWDHDQYVRVTGTIVEVEKDNDDDDYSCRVDFGNGVDDLWYPMENIDKHILEPIELDELFYKISKL
jgi:hypothetical protein